MLVVMNTLSPPTLALRGAGLGPSGWPTAAATADASAGRQAAAWFNEPLVEGSQVLRAPVQPTAGDAQALCQRFLACLSPEAV